MKTGKTATLETIVKLFSVPLFILIIAVYSSATTENSAAMGLHKISSTATQNDSLKAVIEFLLTSSATDFHQHQPPVVLAFRKVKVGHLIISEGQKRYVLCGEFLSQDKKDRNEWTLFATVKTSGYEQWIGNQALPFCQDPKIKWAKLNDLSSALKNRLEAFRKQ